MDTFIESVLYCRQSILRKWTNNSLASTSSHSSSPNYLRVCTPVCLINTIKAQKSGCSSTLGAKTCTQGSACQRAIWVYAEYKACNHSSKFTKFTSLWFKNANSRTREAKFSRLWNFCNKKTTQKPCRAVLNLRILLALFSPTGSCQGIINRLISMKLRKLKKSVKFQTFRKTPQF